MIVSYGQMMHPAREAGAARVRDQLGRPVDVHVDQTNAGPWTTARRVWMATPATCRWRCLLQDDVDLAPDFADALEWLLTQFEGAIAGRPLALYNGLTHLGGGPHPPADVPAPGHQWIERRDGVQGPVIVLAQGDVEPMLTWCWEHIRPDAETTSADIRPSLWLESRGRTSLAPVPSWVQHRGGEPSLLGTPSYRSMPRTASTFRPGVPLASIDWSAGLTGATCYGHRFGAAQRVRWKLWRNWQPKADYLLEQIGINPRNGVGYAEVEP